MSSRVPYLTKQQLFDIRPNARIRTSITIDDGRTTGFAVQLECEVETDDWRPVVRYDTAGGQIHRDKLKLDGSYRTHRETRRIGSDPDSAIKNAKKDLSEGCDSYLDEFLK